MLMSAGNSPLFVIARVAGRPEAIPLKRSLRCARNDMKGEPLFLTNERGIIALTTVIIIGAIILAVGVSAALVGQTEITLAGQSDREYLARGLASACIDEAMLRLKRNSGYTGGSVPIGSDTCVAAVTGSGSSRTITATATSDVFTKAVTVAASLKSNVAGNASAWHIDSWTEGDPP